MKIHHDCDIIILSHKKHGLGYTVGVYGTEGLAEMFIGSSALTRSKEGHAIVDLFERFMISMLSEYLHITVNRFNADTSLHVQ